MALSERSISSLSLTKRTLAPPSIECRRARSALMEGGAAASANDLAWLRKRFGDQTRAVVLTANPTHPQLAAIGDTPMFEKPLNDAKINAIGALLQSL